MSDPITAIRPQDTPPLMDTLQERSRHIPLAGQPDALSSPAVTVQMRISPQMLEDTGAADSVSQVQAEAQRGVNVVDVHKGLDPQRVAKLIGLLD